MSNVKFKIAISALTTLLLLSGLTVQQAVAQVAGRVVVAKSGGDYTSISAALAAISPTSANPYLIEVMPGTYTEFVTMKSYVHLRGAGREVTTIQGPSASSDVMTLNSLTKVDISGFTITSGNHGIVSSSSSYITISQNTFRGQEGVFLTSSPSAVITGNNFEAGPTTNVHIRVESSSPLISNNVLSAIQGEGILLAYSASPIITGNTILGGIYYGIDVRLSSSPSIIHNKIVGNSLADIIVDSSSTPNISFNIYDTISGTTGVGLYNVKSNGTAAPNP